MKKGLAIQILVLLLVINCLPAQVSTNFNNENVVSGRGQFLKNYRQTVDFIIPAKNIDSLLLIERNELALSYTCAGFLPCAPFLFSIVMLIADN